MKFHFQQSWRPHTDSSLHYWPGPPPLEMCQCHQGDSATHLSHPLFQTVSTATGTSELVFQWLGLRMQLPSLEEHHFDSLVGM